MSVNNQQEEFLKDFKLRDCHVFLSDDDVDFVKSKDVDGNISKGMKNIIYTLKKQTRMITLERYFLLILVLAIFILGVYQIIMV